MPVWGIYTGPPRSIHSGTIIGKHGAMILKGISINKKLSLLKSVAAFNSGIKTLKEKIFSSKDDEDDDDEDEVF